MYESWRQPWDRYGLLVQDVVLALDGGGSASNHEVVAAAAAAFHGEGDHFDPVEALVAPLLLHRSRAERRMAAAVLVAHGIGEDRARAITRARGTLPLAGDGEAASPVMSFDALAAAVGPLHCVQSEVWPSHRWVRAITVSTLAVIAMVIGGLGWRAQHQRHSGRNAYLLWPKQLPKPWVLISAQATGPNPIRAQGPLVQTLSVGYSMSAQITIGDQVQQFVEPALGLTTDHSVHMVDEAWFSAAHAQVTDIGSGRIQARWREQGHNVFLESRGLSVDKVRSWVTGLVPRTDFVQSGYESPGWTESHTGGVGTTPSTEMQGVTMLGFQSTEHPQEFVTVRAVPVSPTEHSDPVPISSGEPFALRNGITARVRRHPTSAMVWWDEKAGVVVNMMSNDTAAVTPMQELAKSFLMGDARQWVAAAKPFRSSLAEGARIDTFTVGPLPVTVHATRMAKGVVCVRTVCAMTDIPSPGVESADLIVAGHWWHLDHAPSTYPAPTWRTAPATALGATYETVRQNYTWRALDLGTAGRALRRGDDDFAFTRPLG